MSENTKDSDHKQTIEPTRVSPLDEVESARILFNEGLIPQAKKTLHRLLAHYPNLQSAILLMKEITEAEMKKLFQPSTQKSGSEPLEDVDLVLKQLDRDLGLDIESRDAASSESWIAQTANGTDTLPIRELYDLGIAFYQMGAYLDALRELRRAEKRIRVESSFLGELGVSIVALISEILVKTGNAFEARSYLEPILIEPDLRHEDKLNLYYEMALAEEALFERERARNWFLKIYSFDPYFRDVAYRLRKP